MPRDPQEQDTQAPHPGSTSGEFTQMFGAFREADPPAQEHRMPATTPPAAPHEEGATAVFSALPSQPEPAAAPAQNFRGASAPPPDPSVFKVFAAEPTPSHEAPTQIFAAQPFAPAARQPLLEETQLYTGGAASHAPAAAPVFAAAVRAPAVVPPPVAPPAPMPPPIHPPAPVPAPGGEFTQIFRPIAPPPSKMPQPTAPVAAPAGEFTQFFSAVSAREEVDKARPSQVAAAPQASPVAATPSAPPPSAQLPTTAPGAFTQMFSQLAESSSPPPPAARPVSQPLPAAPLPPAPPAQPIFGAPAPQGSFTELFSGGAGGPGAGAFDVFGAQPVSASAFPAAPLLPGYGGGPAQLPPQPAPPASSGGEFTRLMGSLQHPGPAVAPQAPSSLPMDAAFFAADAPAGGADSEYTRVLRGQPQGSVHAPAGPPAAGSAAAPGLALAPEAKAAAPKEQPAKEKPKTVVILLVAIIGLLLLVILLLAYFVLRHR